MRLASLLLVPLLVTFGCSSGGDGPARPDAGGFDAGPLLTDGGPRDSGSTGPVDLGPAQELSAMLTADACGNLHASANVDVPAGSEVTICAGSQLMFDDGMALRVHGTLHVAGTAGSRVTFAATSGKWGGFIVYGTLDAHFFDMTGAQVGVQTLAGATTTVDDSTIVAPDRSSYGFDISGGGTIDRTTITGGAQMTIHSGMLSMTDSTIDLNYTAPIYAGIDCTHNTGGGVTLDHVHIHGCHCPLHFDATDMPVMVTNSDLSDSAVSTMIDQTTATYHGNDLGGVSLGMDEINSGTAVTADISGNWWGRATANLYAIHAADFTGATDVLAARPAGVGPR